MRANEELDTQRNDLFNVSGNKSVPNVKILLYDDSIRFNLCFNQKTSIKGRGELSPRIEILPHSKSFAFMHGDLMHGEAQRQTIKRSQSA